MNLAQANPLRWPIGIKLPMVAAFFPVCRSGSRVRARPLFRWHFSLLARRIGMIKRHW